jgi:hypothetical protein
MTYNVNDEYEELNLYDDYNEYSEYEEDDGSYDEIEHFKFKKIGRRFKKISRRARKGIKKTTKTVNKGIKKGVKGVKKGIGGGIGGILKGIRIILKLVKKIVPFFGKFLPLFTKLFPWMLKGVKSIPKFVKSWAKIGKFITNPKKAIAALLTFTVPVVGQLVARGMLYNGSLHLPWLLLFATPPVTLVPMLAMMLGYIKPLRGGPPWDTVVWLPIAGLTIGSLLSDNNKVMNVFKIILGVGSFYLAYQYKSKKVCGDKDTKSKVALDAMNSYMIVIILGLVMPYIPYIGTFFTMIQAVLPKSDLFLQAFAVLLVYSGTNIFNGSFKALCKLHVKNDALYGILLSAIALTFMVSFSPGSVASQMSRMR